jgi:hypothetical protein
VAPGRPVLNDAKFFGSVIKKTINITRNEHIDIKDECWPHEATKSSPRKKQLQKDIGPTVSKVIFGRSWNFYEVNLWVEALSLVRAAIEIEAPVKMTPNGPKQIIDEAFTVAISPKGTKHINWASIIEIHVRLCLYFAHYRCP